MEPRSTQRSNLSKIISRLMAAQKSVYWKNIAFLAVIIFIASFYLNSRTEKPWWLKWTDQKELPHDSLAAPAKAPLPETEADLLADYNACIDCLNRHSDRITAGRRRYLSWADEKKGPTGKEKNIYGLYQAYDPADCLQKTQQAFSQQTERAPLVAAYQQALQETYDSINTLYDYYDHEDYKDDQMAHGKAQHAAILRTFAQYETAAAQLNAELDLFRERYWQARIPHAPGNPASLEIATYQLVHTAMTILDTCHGRPVLELDANALDQLIQELSANMYAVTEISAQQATAPGSTQIATAQLSEAADDFLKSAKLMMRRARDQEAFTDFEKRMVEKLHSTSVEGAFPHLATAYEKLIRSYNQVWRKAAVPRMCFVPSFTPIRRESGNP